MSEQIQLEALQKRLNEQEERLAGLETGLTKANAVILGLQRTIVDLTADHIHRLFNDPVMIDSLTQRMLIAGANAIAHKAKTSRQRTPQLVVIEQYIPGAIRATLHDDGTVLIEEQDKATHEWMSGEDLSEAMRSDEIQTAFGNLLVAYTAEVGKAYFITEDVYLEEFRAKASEQALGVVKAVETVAAGAMVAVTARPAPLGDEPAVEGQDMTVELPAGTVFHIEREEGVVEVLAADVKAGDIAVIQRDGAVMKEVIVAVTPVVGEAPAAE
ncbi:hypothetical protein D3C76_89350 [compost metagenome]